MTESTRRRFRRYAAAILVTMLAFTGAGIAFAFGWIDPFTSRTVTATPSLPRHIGAPSIFTRDARRVPMGAASVAFSGGTWGYDDNETFELALTGARSDTYRFLPEWVDSTAGITAVLAPDGRRIAVEGGVLDLTTGELRRLPHAFHDAEPQAWSPDGRYLAVMVYTSPDYTPPDSYTGPWTDPVTKATLTVVDTADGQTFTVGDLRMTAEFDGWIAAFSRDGSKLAYQTGDRIQVADVARGLASGFATAVTGGIDVPNGTRIAGKGAWTPDDNGIAVVSEDRCSCRRAYDAKWTLRTLDLASGTATGAAYPVDGVVGIRMLGWSRAGQPVVATYDPEPVGDLDPTYEVSDFRTHADGPVDTTGDYQAGLEYLDNVGSARVLGLNAHGPAQTLLRAGWDQAEAVDVADDVIAGGVSRAGDPPVGTFDQAAIVAAATFAFALVGVVGVGGWAVAYVSWRRSLPRRPLRTH